LFIEAHKTLPFVGMAVIMVGFDSI
jgi:hypothetical protein